MRTNFNMNDENITMVRGDTLAFNVEITDQDGEVILVDSAHFTCKKNVTGAEKIFQKSLGSGIIQSDGLLTVRVAPEDTREVDAGQYFYDMEIGVGSDIYTLMIGTLSIQQDVTF
jgi:hypothetical protein